VFTIYRKVRQALLTRNKFSSYLLYAIGEIILVVYTNEQSEGVKQKIKDIIVSIENEIE